MLKTDQLDLKSAGVLNSLVSDYVNRDEKTLTLYSHYPDEKGFAEFLSSNPFQEINRKALVTSLREQIKQVDNNSRLTLDHIHALEKPGVYTVTTGHQLCLFTGPLYFIYKIVSVINLARRLSEKFPGSQFVPVYWMASEDHDFEEVNHFSVMGRKITWQSDQQGAVGNFKTAELEKLLPDVEQLFKNTSRGEYLTSLFKRTYLGHRTLAQATRFLVNELFGKYGLVTIDGNDAQLKGLFSKEMRKDIFENTAFNCVEETITGLKKSGYHIQVNPRPINCFYLDGNRRERIERTDKGFILVGSGQVFTEQEMEDIICDSPQKISPNVTLRPMYQQTILPNIAYVGGPGELAYWLEYKKMAEAFNVTFPILVPRSFILVAEESAVRKMKKLGFSPSRFFSGEEELVKSFQQEQNRIMELEKEKLEITAIYEALRKKAGAIDQTLEGNVSAQLQKALKGIHTLEEKANRSLRQQSATELSRIRSLKQELFPGGVPQERVENFSTFFLKFGDGFLETVKQIAQPLSLKQQIIIEE